MESKWQSWGRYPNKPQTATTLHWQSDWPQPEIERKVLPYGMGRSYGDSCLNSSGTLICTRGLSRFLEFSENGVLRCEAGVTLDEVLKVVVPRGWFLPVTPGTKFVTIGGAIANDVHGKNHHKRGTFGAHVLRFELVRSNGERLICSPKENTEYFEATIGGLGLTGIITWAEVQLISVASSYLQVETLKFRNLDEFFEISSESDQNWEYTVSWVDTHAKGTRLGRGLFMRGRFEADGRYRLHSDKQKPLPVDAPEWLLGPWSVRAFNEVYYRKSLRRRSVSQVHYDPYFYPLDKLQGWNRLYGKRGFLQYQFVVPPEQEKLAVAEVLDKIAHSGRASFLAVLKRFGEKKSPGWLSFPMPGTTLALDFANEGGVVFNLLDSLDETVRKAGGRVYPAKDARMSSLSFKHSFPQWYDLEKLRDPMISSDFWQRVTKPPQQQDFAK